MHLYFELQCTQLGNVELQCTQLGNVESFVGYRTTHLCCLAIQKQKGLKWHVSSSLSPRCEAMPVPRSVSRRRLVCCRPTDVEGMECSWDSSQWIEVDSASRRESGNEESFIPQLDGPIDEKSDISELTYLLN